MNAHSLTIAREVALTKGFDWDSTLEILAKLAEALPGLALGIAKVLQAFPDHTEADKLGKLIEAFVEALKSKAS